MYRSALAQIAREQRCAQSVHGVVGERDRVVEIVRDEAREHGTEQLSLREIGVGGASRTIGRRNEEAAREIGRSRNVADVDALGVHLVEHSLDRRRATRR